MRIQVTFSGTPELEINDCRLQRVSPTKCRHVTPNLHTRQDNAVETYKNTETDTDTDTSAHTRRNTHIQMHTYTYMHTYVLA